MRGPDPALRSRWVRAIHMPSELGKLRTGELAGYDFRIGRTVATPGTVLNSFTRLAGAETKIAFSRSETDPVTAIFRDARSRLMTACRASICPR